MSRMSPLIHMLSVPLFVLFVTSAAPLAAQEYDPKLEELAHNLASKIRKELPLTKSEKARFTYVVFDFRESAGKTSQLGVHLADELSDALRNQLPGLRPVERSKLREFFEQERFDPTEFEMHALGLWAARALEANLAIVGIIEPTVAAFRLHVRAITCYNDEASAMASFK